MKYHIVYRTALLLPFLAQVARQDLKEQRTGRWLTTAGLLESLFFRLLFEGSFSFLSILESILFPVVLLLPLFLVHGIGAGDLKLFSVISCMLGISAAVKIIWFSMVCGAFYAFFYSIRRRSLRIGRKPFTGCILAGTMFFFFLSVFAA